MPDIGFIADELTYENGLLLLYENLSQHCNVEQMQFGVEPKPQLYITNIAHLIPDLAAPVIYFMTKEAGDFSLSVNDLRAAFRVFTYSDSLAKQVAQHYKVQCYVQSPALPELPPSTGEWIVCENILEGIQEAFPNEHFVDYSYDALAGAKLFLHRPPCHQHFNMRMRLAAAYGVPTITERVEPNSITIGDTLLSDHSDAKKWIQAIKVAMRDRKINSKNTRQGIARYNQNNDLNEQVKKTVRNYTSGDNLAKHAAAIKQQQHEKRLHDLHERRMQMKSAKVRVIKTDAGGVPQKLQVSKQERAKGVSKPVVTSNSIFVTGGIGDVIALESHFSEELRNKLDTIYYATSKWEPIKQLFESVPNFPKLRHHVVVWDDFSRFWCFLHKKECIREMTNHKLDVPKSFQQAPDYGIVTKFPQITAGMMPYTYSSFIKHTLCGIEQFALPLNYVAICPYSTDKRLASRDFDQADWKATIDYVEQHNITGVVINNGNDVVPNHRLIVNLTNQTNIAQAVEIVKSADGYIGIDSSLSVIATKVHAANQIVIKSGNSHLFHNKAIYYAFL